MNEDIIYYLVQSIKKFLKDGTPELATNLLLSQDIQDSIEFPINYKGEDFLYAHVCKFGNLIESWPSKFFQRGYDGFAEDIEEYNDWIHIYNAYSDICSLFGLVESNGVLKEVYDILCEKRNSLTNLISRPIPPEDLRNRLILEEYVKH